MQPLIRLVNTHNLRLIVCLCAVCGAFNLGAQTPPTPKILSAQTLEGNVLVMPFDTSLTGEMITSGGARISIAVEGDYRVYRALHDGKEHYVHVALEGPPRRLAFDPKEERFRDVLPSLRVELGNYDQLDEFIEAAGGIGGKAYEALGFAIVRLPKDKNPAEVASRIGALPGVKSARIQLRGPLHVPM